MVGRHGYGEANAVRIVMLFDDAREETATANAITTHDNWFGDAITVEIRAAERLGVACTQFENIAHLHPTRGAQHSAALWTAIAILCRHDVLDQRCPIIAAIIRMPEVIALGIRTGHEVGG